MKSIKKITLSLMLFGLISLPSFAKLEGSVSKGIFYDPSTVLSPDVAVDTNLKTETYWTNNIFYNNSKYYPVFMLSNKELFNIVPRSEKGVVRRIVTPSVYSISLKSASIKTVSFKPVNSKTGEVEKKEVKTIAKSVNTPDLELISLYEQAKNPGVDTEQKINTIVKLKDSKKTANYELALNLLDDVIKQEPYNAYAYYLKGEIYVSKKDNKNAMKNYLEALKINPYSEKCCLGIAKILEPTNKELAQKYYDRVK